MSSSLSTHQRKLVVLSAPSGAGKSTIASMILEKFPNDFQVSISYTTRAPRGTEQNGVHYFFVDEAEFQRMIKVGAFLEYAYVFGKNWYGTSRGFVEDIFKKNKNVLFDIDVQGAESLKTAYKDRCLTIFIDPPSFEVLEKRLRARNTESEEAVQLRLETARKELKEAPKFDYRVVNHDLNQAYDEVVAILKKEGCL